MHTLSQEFLALCRQLGEAQTRCSAALATQAAELERLQREVVRLRAAVIVRDTRLEQAHAALEEARQAQPPGLPRRKEMARHIRTLAERVTALSRECLRWRLQAVVGVAGAGAGIGAGPSAGLVASAPAMGIAAVATPEGPSHASQGTSPIQPDLDESLAAADLVICQTGCISHDEYWRVQDHCRRTGKPCILVDQASPAPGVHVLQQPVMVLRMAQGLRAVRGVPGWGQPGDLPVGVHAALQTTLDSNAIPADVLEQVHK